MRVRYLTGRVAGHDKRSYVNFVDFHRRPANTEIVRRLSAIVLLLAFASTGSGLTGHLHLREHLRPGASLHAGAAWTSDATPGHDEGNCAVCMTLHMPALAAGYVPVLVFLGLWVAFLTSVAPRMTPQRSWSSIDCRGPPVY